MELVDKEWVEKLKYPHRLYRKVAHGGKTFWLLLFWSKHDPWQAFLCDNTAHNNTEPGKAITPDIFFEMQLHYKEDDWSIAEFAALDAAREWLEMNWDQIRYRLVGERQ